MTMSERLAVMQRGKIEQIGRPDEVYENPATAFVAGFLGASNMLEGEVVERNGDVGVVRLGSGSSVTVPTERLNGAGSRVRVGVRPEKIRLEANSGEAPEGWNSVLGTVRLASFMGVSHQYSVEAGGRSLTVYAQNVGGARLPAPGDQVRLVWRPEHTFVVAAEVNEGEEKEKP